MAQRHHSPAVCALVALLLSGCQSTPSPTPTPQWPEPDHAVTEIAPDPSITEKASDEPENLGPIVDGDAILARATTLYQKSPKVKITVNSRERDFQIYADGTDPKNRRMHATEASPETYTDLYIVGSLVYVRESGDDKFIMAESSSETAQDYQKTRDTAFNDYRDYLPRRTRTYDLGKEGDKRHYRRIGIPSDRKERIEVDFWIDAKGRLTHVRVPLKDFWAENMFVAYDFPGTVTPPPADQVE